VSPPLGRLNHLADHVVVCSLAALFAALAAFNAWVAFLFKRRAVAEIRQSEDGVVLIPQGTSFEVPVSTGNVRVVRRFGEQFSRNESATKFALLQAGSRYWVASAVIEIPPQ
jgi:hypothetical protein